MTIIEQKIVLHLYVVNNITSCSTSNTKNFPMANFFEFEEGICVFQIFLIFNGFLNKKKSHYDNVNTSLKCYSKLQIQYSNNPLNINNVFRRFDINVFAF